jgi:riboflavin synthase
MFTGLIEELGRVKAIRKTSKSAQITVSARAVLEGLALGDSIATNGVCLSVVAFDDNSFTVDAVAETMRRSNLNTLKVNDAVNLERALALSDRLGGHLVAGHVDGVGRLERFEREGNAIWMTIAPPENLLRYIVEKGSIAIDGVSLTVAYVDAKRFKVSIIPLTSNKTTLLDKPLQAKLNLEVDMVGKYIEKQQGLNRDLSLAFLKEHGYA